MSPKKQRKYLTDLANAIQSIDQRLRGIEAHNSLPAPKALDTALETFATAAVHSSSENLKALGSFMRDITEIGAQHAARALGKRRAKNATRGARGRFLPARILGCRLCSNPAIADPQVDEIRAHANHNGMQAPPPAPRERVEEPEEIEVESTVQPEVLPPADASWPHVSVDHSGHNHAAPAGENEPVQ